jgi:hypothetical protein
VIQYSFVVIPFPLTRLLYIIVGIWTDTDDCPDEKAGDKCYDEWDAPRKGTCLEFYGIRHVQGSFAV